MNPPSHSPATSPTPPAAGISLDDALFILFRQKWIILGFLALACAGAMAVRTLRPPLYLSVTKLKVQYVEPTRPASPIDPEQPPRLVDWNAETIIASEIEILRSFDVAIQAAQMVGPEKILARKGGGNDLMLAAGVIASGIEVDPPKSSVLTVTFKHPDPQVVKPVLEALIQSFLRKELEMQYGNTALDALDSKLKDELERELQKTEEELLKLRVEGKVLLSVDETKRAYQTQIAKTQDELLNAERELAEGKAVWGGQFPASNGTNEGQALVASDKLSEYGYIAARLATLRMREPELLLTYTSAHPEVQAVHAQIDKLTRQKAELDQAYPALASLTSSNIHGTNGMPGGAAVQLADLTRLNARIAWLGAVLTNLQADAANVVELEPKINEVTRRRDEEKKSYDFKLESIKQRKMAESAVISSATNMKVAQEPTPPALDSKKMLKQVAAVFAGLIALGLGLAFVKEMFLDRSLKRPADVERHLRMPVFLTVPDIAPKGLLSWIDGHSGKQTGMTAGTASNGAGSGPNALVPWDSAHFLQVHAEGLRERLMTYFEVHNLNLKKPKLVALTGCGAGSGVSSLASSLAAALSRTGDGSVLLVDMNGGQNLTQQFRQGRPGCGLAQVLEPEGRATALVRDNLYVVRLEEDGKADGLAMVLPRRFNHLVPKLKASDYDYVIFDMPPVAPASPTARLAGSMDIVLLVIEAEKTAQTTATRATTLLRESKCNVVPVLNKYRQRVPAALGSGL